MDPAVKGTFRWSGTTTLIFTPTTYNPAYNETLGRYPYSPIISTNPLDVIENWKAESNVNRFIGSFNTIWSPRSDVTVSYLFGFDRGDESFDYYIPPRATGATFTGSVQSPRRAIQRYNNDLTATIIHLREQAFDRMVQMAWDLFGKTPATWERVQAVMDAIVTDLRAG